MHSGLLTIAVYTQHRHRIGKTYTHAWTLLHVRNQQNSKNLVKNWQFLVYSCFFSSCIDKCSKCEVRNNNNNSSNTNTTIIVIIMTITTKKQRSSDIILLSWCMDFTTFNKHSYTQAYVIYFQELVGWCEDEAKNGNHKAFIYSIRHLNASQNACVDQKDGNFTYENIMRWHFF